MHRSLIAAGARFDAHTHTHTHQHGRRISTLWPSHSLLCVATFGHRKTLIVHTRPSDAATRCALIEISDTIVAAKVVAPLTHAPFVTAASAAAAAAAYILDLLKIALMDLCVEVCVCVRARQSTQDATDYARRDVSQML